MPPAPTEAPRGPRPDFPPQPPVLADAADELPGLLAAALGVGCCFKVSLLLLLLLIIIIIIIINDIVMFIFL